MNVFVTPCGSIIRDWPDGDLVNLVASDVSPSVHRYDPTTCTTFYDPDGRNGVLSNPHATSIMIDGEEWGSVEAVYQAIKHWADDDVREAIRTAPDGIAAKAVAKANSKTIAPEARDAFGRDKTRIMAGALILRARRDAVFADFLESTGASRLVEATPARSPDPHWGAVGSDVLIGMNVAGRLLEGLRAALPRLIARP